MDEDHIYDIHIDASHFLEWFAAKPDKEAVEDWNGESEIDCEGDEADLNLRNLMMRQFDYYPVPCGGVIQKLTEGHLKRRSLKNSS